MTNSDSYELHGGDALNLLDDAETLPDESVHAIVTDPPYGIAFMGESWDDFDPHAYQEWCQEWAEAAMRAVKPGGHLVAFSGERTFHRLMCGVEDAGWEIRTSVMWLHGQGFPKGADVSKHIDRYHDAEREVVGYTEDTFSGNHERHAKDPGEYPDRPITPDPVTSEAERWDGWKTQLKPAHEPIVVARKPLSESAIYRNVLEHGTGAYNIDATRIPAGDKEPFPSGVKSDSETVYGGGDGMYADRERPTDSNPEGRYPANVCLDPQAAAMLDAQSGPCPTGDLKKKNWGPNGTSDKYGDLSPTEGKGWTGDTGGASRFYYTSKASTNERTHDGEVENDHPTVKPVSLCEWLVRLVTAEGQVVLDPFLGSGTTGVAALKEDRQFIGIEQNDEYLDIARRRLELTAEDKAQQTLADAAEAEADD